MNTTFLQLVADMKPGDLAWDPRQRHAVCDGDPAAWSRSHDICLLLTHHPVDGWYLDRASSAGKLLQDGGTKREILEVERTRANRNRLVAAGLSSGERRQRAVADAYLRHALRLNDIIDLANLPEGDRNLARQTFLLRQLYAPLRLRLVSPDADETGSVDPAAGAKRHLDVEPRVPRAAADERVEAGEVLRSLGKVLGEHRRLVILGDPGGGKTTLLRWLTTALLLRRQGDVELTELPDADTLPKADWLPVLIRCRELRGLDLASCTFEDVLRTAIRRSEVPEAQVPATTDALRDMLEAGEALLLVDGLDEVADPRVRAAFCAQIDKVSRLWKAPIVATSRLVGYREMGIRLTGDFAHATLAELSKAARVEFLERWCRVTEPPNRATQALNELKEALANERIARLAGNPMLLTTLALVKRQVGKLPSRRVELYRHAVETSRRCWLSVSLLSLGLHARVEEIGILRSLRYPKTGGKPYVSAWPRATTTMSIQCSMQ